MRPDGIVQQAGYGIGVWMLKPSEVSPAEIAARTISSMVFCPSSKVLWVCRFCVIKCCTLLGQSVRLDHLLLLDLVVDHVAGGHLAPDFVQLNAELSKSWPVLTVRKDAPADAKEWDGKPDKLPVLER